MQVSARVLSGSKEGANLIKEVEQGITLSITRALVDPGLALPYIDCHIDVPHVLASITDEEYTFCCNVSLANLREPMRLPKCAQWVQQQVNAAAQPAAAACAAAPEAATPRPRRLSAESGFGGATDVEQAPPLVSNRLRSTLRFGTVELELRNEHTGGTTVPLALLHSSNLFISYVSEGPGHMDVHICLPKVEAHDLRAARRARSSLVLSSSYHITDPQQSRKAGAGSAEAAETLVGPSLLTLHYVCQSSGAQDVALRLQRPTIVAEVDFMAAMLHFVVPSLSLGADPTPFLQHDLQCVPAAMHCMFCACKLLHNAPCTIPLPGPGIALNCV